MSEVTWGSGADLIKFRALQVNVQSDDQIIPGTRVNTAEMDRLTRKGVQPVRFSDFSGGLTRVGGIGSAKNDINKYALNQGIVTRIPGLGYLPYLPTVQTSIASEQDISPSGGNFVALNKRLHAINASNGDTALRWLCGLGINVLGDTSGTNGAVVQRLGDGQDYVTAAANLFLNSASSAAFAFRNVSEATGVIGRTDVSGSGAGSGVNLVALGTAGDTIWGMQYMAGLGPTGANIFTGQVAGSNQLYYALGSATIPATLLPVVDTSSKTVEGTLAVATTSAQAPTSVWQENAGSVVWASLTNLQASDNAYATAPITNSPAITNALRVDFGGQFALAVSAIVKGIQVAVEGHEAAANNDTLFNSVTITLDSTSVGAERANYPNIELNATTDTTTTFGTTTDSFGLAITSANLQTIGTRIVLQGLGGVNNGTASIDTVTMAITYRLPGTALKLNEGGWAVTPHPLFPNRFAYVEPVVDDKTAITQPRRLCFVDMEWDTTGNRPTGTRSYPSVGGIAYIHHVVPFLGGYLITGSSSAGPGDRVVLLKSDGTTLDYQFPGFMGSTQMKVNALFPLGFYFAAQVVASDYSEMQYWLYDTTRNFWYTDTLIQSKTGTSIALQPIPYAETTLGLQQNLIYSIFPLTTHTAIRREFMPPDLNQDPRTTNTTQTKYASALYIQSMEMEFGYPEASNSLVQLEYQERQIGDATSATGTVKVEVETGGSIAHDTYTPFGSPTVSTTFTTGHSATPGSRGIYQIPGGKPYQTQIVRFTADQGSGTTTSGPNILAVLETTVQEWAQDLRVYEFQLAPDGHSKPDMKALLEEFERLRTVQNVQPLREGSTYVNSSYKGVVGWKIWVDGRGAPEKGADQVATPIVRFAEAIGSPT